LNTRPRATHDWRTPLEVFARTLANSHKPSTSVHDPGVATRSCNRPSLSSTAARQVPVNVHPCRSVERKPENNEKTRFLSDDERTRLLAACKASPWPRLYGLILLALTTGARKGELLGLTWTDIDLERRLAHVGRSKN
jgi:integrase